MINLWTVKINKLHLFVGNICSWTFNCTPGRPFAEDKRRKIKATSDDARSSEKDEERHLMYVDTCFSFDLNDQSIRLLSGQGCLLLVSRQRPRWQVTFDFQFNQVNWSPHAAAIDADDLQMYPFVQWNFVRTFEGSLSVAGTPCPWPDE